jgi:hypothetical protein
MSRAQRRKDDDERYRKWNGAYKPYDLIKEASIAIGVVLGLAVLLTILFSSPDETPTTVKSWARAAPLDFVSVATSELDGTSGTAGYGPPYNSASTGQQIAFIHLAKWFGVDHPINAAQDFVILPLRTIPSAPGLQAAVNTYQKASAKTQATWTANYAAALCSTPAAGMPCPHPAGVNANGSVLVARGDYGPVPAMMRALLADAQAGGLDGQLLTSSQFYQTDYTKILMLLQDDDGSADPNTAGSGYFFNRATDQNLQGGQWGMMNETGQYPGQVWLWLYTFWYQVKPFSTSANADILVMAIMTALSICLVLVPSIPIVRDLPRRIPIYKLIWREHYRSLSRS